MQPVTKHESSPIGKLHIEKRKELCPKEKNDTYLPLCNRVFLGKGRYQTTISEKNIYWKKVMLLKNSPEKEKTE